jgi:hypothetical protein
MALQVNFKHTPIGFDTPAVLNEAYLRVDSLSGTKNKLFVTVGFYNKKNNEMVLAQQNIFEFNPNVENNSSNFIAQAYAHLKTLPEFAGATDC